MRWPAALWYSDTVKAAVVCACVSCLALGRTVTLAQVAIPATPKKFTTRSTGGQGGGTAVVSSDGRSINLGPAASTPSPKIRYTTHVALSDARQWKSTDGKSLVGKLIAFEDITFETDKGAQPPPVSPPANPTVVKDGKVRLLVDKKDYELPLDRLSEADRTFVEAIQDALSRKTGAPGK